MTTLFAMLLAASLAAAPRAAPDSPAPAGEVSTLTAAVRSHDPETRTLEMITGVGHALRAVRVSLAPECRIMKEGAAAAAADLKPGAIVRVRSSRAAEPGVALEIEILNNDGGKP